MYVVDDSFLHPVFANSNALINHQIEPNICPYIQMTLRIFDELLHLNGKSFIRKDL